MHLRIASYNVHKCIGLDRKHDPERVLRGLCAMDADIIALQEADRRFGARGDLALYYEKALPNSGLAEPAKR